MRFHELRTCDNEKATFPLFDDSEVGLSSEWVQDQIIEARMDDDAATDSGIYEGALRQVDSDIEQAEYLISLPDTKLGNVSICDRVANPDNYNRDGKLRRKRGR